MHQVSRPPLIVSVNCQNLRASWIPRYIKILMIVTLYIDHGTNLHHSHINIYNILLQIYTTDDGKEMEVYVPSAKETCIFYDQAWFPSLNLKAKLEASWSKVFHDPVIRTCMHICTKTYTDTQACMLVYTQTHHSLLLLTLCAKVRELKQIYFMNSLMLYC